VYLGDDTTELEDEGVDANGRLLKSGSKKRGSSSSTRRSTSSGSAYGNGVSGYGSRNRPATTKSGEGGISTGVVFVIIGILVVVCILAYYYRTEIEEFTGSI
jgi:hypothetical protein